MTNKKVNKVAIIGSGIMGSGIACHFANIGIPVLLYDIAPTELTEHEKQKGLSLSSPEVRNRIVQSQFTAAINQKIAPLYKKEFADRISLYNLSDDLELLKEADWIMEVVVERLDIKIQLLDKLLPYIKSDALITTNTSGIPINMIIDGFPREVQQRFCGTHFFNPPRYLELLEIIPTKETAPEWIEFLMDFGVRRLGKKTIQAKDTPAFVANRIGVFSIMHLFHTVQKMDLKVEFVDKVTGALIGRPKSATFRTSDVVGIDTLLKVAKGVALNCPNDEAQPYFQFPGFLEKMDDNKWYGEKSGQGFYKKTVNDQGQKEILSLNLKSMEYEPQTKPKLDVYETVKDSNDWVYKWRTLLQDQTEVGELLRLHLGAVFAYVSHRIPEISDTLFQIDDAMKGGFGWKQGPFELWQLIGIEYGMQLIKDAGFEAAEWINEMLEDELVFYPQTETGKDYYDVGGNKTLHIPNSKSVYNLDKLKTNKSIWSNKACHLIDIGDNILLLQFQTKMNSIDGDVLAGLQKAVDLAEHSFDGLVIANQDDNFSVGANIGMIFMLAVEQEWQELAMAVSLFQQTLMRLRYSDIPVVIAPYNMALGGGCEMSMHADKIVSHAELYMGLVEFGVGVIPGGGGTKEMTLRASELYRKGIVNTHILQDYFMTIAMAKVSTSAYEAIDLGFLEEHKDIILTSKDRIIGEAKKQALSLHRQGYARPLENTKIKVFGKEALGMFAIGIDSMLEGHFISEYDAHIANKLAYVMAGGELSEPTEVSESYLLDLEREAFLSLCGERKTLERIQHMITTGKPLRN